MYWVGMSWFGGTGPNPFPGLVSVSLCVSRAPELPSLASYLRESLVSPLVLSLRYPFHRCCAYGDGAPLTAPLAVTVTVIDRRPSKQEAY